MEDRPVSYRCNQAICDFADALYPDLPATISANDIVCQTMGILTLPDELPVHMTAHSPTVLRHGISAKTLSYGDDCSATPPLGVGD